MSLIKNKEMSDEKKKIVHVVYSIDRKYGGPSYSIPALLIELTKTKELEVSLLLSDCQGINEEWKLKGLKILNFNSELINYLREIRGNRIQRRSLISKIIKGEIDLVHIHGIWHWYPSLIAFLCIYCKVPYVIHARGMLMQGALEYKRVRKLIAYHLYQRLIIKRAVRVYATSPLERRGILRFKEESKIKVIENGVDAPKFVERKFNGNEITYLYLSRIHPIKGIEYFLDAWEAFSTRGMRLLLVGGGDKDYVDKIKDKIGRMKNKDSVCMSGPVYGVEKEKLFIEANYFVLPSLSENFGVVVVEALSYGVPVITTTGTPWEILKVEDAGWHVPGNVQSLGLAILESRDKTSDEWLQMSVNSKKIAERYQWKQIAEKLNVDYHRIFSEDI